MVNLWYVCLWLMLNSYITSRSLLSTIFSANILDYKLSDNSLRVQFDLTMYICFCWEFLHAWFVKLKFWISISSYQAHKNTYIRLEIHFNIALGYN